MTSSKDAKKAAVQAFNPSFSGTIEPFGSLFKEAYRKATDKSARDNVFDKIDRNPDGTQHFEVENGTSVGSHTVTGAVSWFEFGHLPVAGTQLSQICASRIGFDFDGDALSLIKIALFVLNPRFLFSENGYTTAVIGRELHYDISQGSKHIGVVIGQGQDRNRSTDTAKIFNELKNGLPQIALEQPTSEWQQFKTDTLLGRMDVEMSWSSNRGKFAKEGDGKAKGQTIATLSGGTDRTTMTLFSPDLNRSFDGLLHESERFGLNVERQGVKVLIVLGDSGLLPDSDKSILQDALLNFGLQHDFRGLVFNNVGAHWLDDAAMGADIFTKESRAAISFNEKAGQTTPARLYVSVNCTVNPTNKGSYLKLLKPGTEEKPANVLNVVVAGSKVRSCKLAVEFKSVDSDSVDSRMNPYAWLADRKASITLKSFAVYGTSGGSEDEYGIDLSFSAQGNAPLARLGASDLKLSEKNFTLVASVLTLGPIFKLASGSVAGPKNKDDKRVSFVEVTSGNDLGGLFGAAALTHAWLFKEALHASELRVTGARILSQPGTKPKRDTAILFDVETEFSFGGASLTSSKGVAVRVENTGILYSKDQYRWVQALQGAFKVSVSNGSLWSFGKSEGLLKVKDVSLKLDKAPILDLTLGMSINLGIVTADDFKVTIDISSGKLSVIPSKIKIDIKEVLTGEGELSLGSKEPDTTTKLDLKLASAQDASADKDSGFSGKLELKLASGLRVAASARVAKFQPNGSGSATAFAAGAEVEFANAVPLFGGLGIKGFGALYAAHFRRAEIQRNDGVPSSLDWLQRAKGEVAIGSIADTKLWEPKYDRWSYGMGALLSLTSCERLLNLNAMLVVEVPGPRVIAFAKFNILAEQVSNKDKGRLKDKGTLIDGMLGVIELDFLNQRVVLGASVDYDIDFARIYGSIGNQFSLRNLTDWYLNIGHFNRHNRAVLKLGDILNGGVTGYFMAAGNQLNCVPRGGRDTVDLPALALALGARAYASIGSGGVYLRMELQAFLNLSLSKNLYAAGGLELSGELFLFIAGIGASNKLFFEFYTGDGGTSLAICGEVCGHIKVGFLKLQGCVGLRIGDARPRKIGIPPLITSACLVSGTNVALFGQGSTRPIDSVLSRMTETSTFEESGNAPLDVVIVISMVAAPDRGDKIGFLDHLRECASVTTFNYGNTSGGYSLTAVTLRKILPRGFVDVDYNNAPAVWWRTTQKPGNGQPLPNDLALLTRRPLSVQNAIPSEETMKRWIDALTRVTSMCNTVAPQVGVHTIPVSAKGQVDGKTGELSWDLPGRFKDGSTEVALNGARPGLLTVKIRQRAGYGTANDLYAGYPRHLARKIVETNTVDSESRPFAFLLLNTLPGGNDRPPTTLSFDCKGFARSDEEEPPSRFFQLLIASKTPVSGDDFECLADNVKVAVSPDVQSLSSEAAFHENYENWRAESLGFLSLLNRPGYGKLEFALLIFNLKSVFNSDHPPRSLQLTWRGHERVSPLLIGAAKFLSIEELRRFETQKSYNASLVGDLHAFLEPPGVPVLDPGSKYEVAVTWNTVGKDIAPASATNRFRFSTSTNPPPELAPYLLATFPAADENLHPYGHRPGFSISSGDILRILQKFPGLRLKISVTEDGNNPVSGKDAQGNTLDWTKGQIYDPALLLDAAVAPGLDRKGFGALPSALLRALRAAIAAGKLPCLNKSINMDRGQWVGIMVDLDPLRGYTVKVELVGVNGHPWPMTKSRKKSESSKADVDLPFLQWHFRAGVQRNLDELRELFARPVERHRKLRSLSPKLADAFATEVGGLSQAVNVSDEYLDPSLGPAAAAATSRGKVAVIPDKALEDTLARWLGERCSLNSETEKTILWRDTADAVVATAIVLRSREPMLRRTRTPKLEHLDTDAGSSDVLKLDWQITRFPSLVESKGINALYVSTSGTCIVGIVDPRRTLGAPISIGAEEYAPHYLPYDGASGKVSLVQVAEGVLKK